MGIYKNLYQGEVTEFDLTNGFKTLQQNVQQMLQQSLQETQGLLEMETMKYSPTRSSTIFFDYI